MERAINDLGIVFWKVFLWSFGWASFQAICSLFFVLILGGIFGVALAFSSFTLRSKFFLGVQLLGDLLFSLPGVVSSFLYLFLVEGLFPSFSTGLWAVVNCHVLFSSFWVTSLLSTKLRAWLNGGGKLELESQALLGGRGFVNFFLKGPMGRKLKREIEILAPYLFVVYFSSFSTVLILGGGPQNANPEVMLFFSLLHDFGSPRVYVWIFGVLFLSYLLGEILRYQKKTGWGELDFFSRGHEKNQLIENLSWGPGVVPLKNIFDHLIRGVLAVSLGFMAWGLFSFLSFDFSKFAGTEFFNALVNSGFFVGFVSIWIIVFSAIFLFPLVKLRGLLSRFWMLGPGWYGAVFLTWGWGVEFQSSIMKFGVASLVFAVSMLPLVSNWIRPINQVLSKHELEAAKICGATKWNLIVDFVLPRMMPYWGRVVVLGGLMALGDVALSSLFLGDQETLTTWGRRMASRYNFSGMSVLAFCLFIFSVFGFGLSKYFYRRTSNA